MNFQSLSKTALVLLCKEKNTLATGTKIELVKRLQNIENQEIDAAREAGTLGELVERKISLLAARYGKQLAGKIDERTVEMATDQNDHHLIYRVLGISSARGKDIDLYQNTGRFLYKYAGSFLEEAATLCLYHAFPEGAKTTIPNTEGQKPKTFEIDFLYSSKAVELKWRDATTDGDHITKEHTRVKVIEKAGYTPVRVMFYYPLRSQAIRIQSALKAIYDSLDGEYYAGDDAWSYITENTGYDLLAILTSIAEENDKSSDNDE